MKISFLIASVLVTTIWATAQEPADTLHQAINLADKTITADNMNKKQVSNPLDAISGRVAGVTVQKTGNGVAAMNAVRVRGTTSLTGGNDPLIIIDGVMGDLSTLSSVYPADIESFTILKDASETAQYGSRGASGVIEVTTKKGSAGRTTVSFNGSFGVSSVSKNLGMLSASEYVKALNDAGLMVIDAGHNTNWQKQIEQTALLHDYNVAFTGGGTNNGYRASLGFMDHDGVVLHEKRRNFTANMSMYQLMFNNLLRVDLGIFGNILKNTTSIYDTQKTFYSAQTFNPTYGTSRNADGSWPAFAYANQINHPLALMDSRTTDKTTHLSTHAKLTFNLSPQWQVVAFGAYSHNEVETDQFLPTSIWAHGQASRGTAKTESLLANVSVTWKKHFGLHGVNVQAFSELQRDTYTGFHTTTTNFSTNALGYDNIQAGAIVPWDGTGSYREVTSLAAFMGSASYDYDNRFAASFTARADGSSRFGTGNKWGFFPSVSASWNMGREEFVRNTSWLNDMKIRAGYGVAGNQGAVDAYASMRTLQPLGTVPVGQESAVAFAMLRNANPNLTWDKKATFNVGVEAAMVGNRVLASVDFYKSKTLDMLYAYDVSVPPFAYSTLLANLGSMSNLGVEISVGVTPIVTRDLELNINANITWQKNKLLSLNGYYNNMYLEGPEYKDIASLNGAGFHGGYNHIVYQIVGQPLGVFYLPHCTGLYLTEDGTYDYQIEDIDGDGVINLANGKDRRVCGQAVPKVLLGSNISLRYKQWDLSLQINGAFGHKIYNGTALAYMNMGSLPGYNVLRDAPKQNIGDQTATDYWLERGDYINFDYLTVGWNAPLRGKVAQIISRLRLSLTVENIATITGYSGLTPMINSSNVSSTLGIDDKNIYPPTRTYSLGLSIYF